MHYRKKPVIIEAFELEGGKTASLPRWLLESDAVCFSEDAAGNLIALRIETLEGTMFARSGDWIIQRRNLPLQARCFRGDLRESGRAAGENP